MTRKNSAPTVTAKYLPLKAILYVVFEYLFIKETNTQIFKKNKHKGGVVKYFQPNLYFGFNFKAQMLKKKNNDLHKMY